MHMNIRRLVGERRHHHKRSKKLGKVCIYLWNVLTNVVSTSLPITDDASCNCCIALQDGKQNHVSFPEFQQNGTAKQFTHGRCTFH